MGPDDGGMGMHWYIDGIAGDVFNIEFKRTFEEGVDTKKVSWSKVRHVSLTEEQRELADTTTFKMIGSWDGWKEGKSMHYDAAKDVYVFYVGIGSKGQESFQILKDGHWGSTIYPSVPDATPHEYHAILGPSDGAAGLNWTIGAHDSDDCSAGDYFEVMLHVSSSGIARRVDWIKCGPPTSAATEKGYFAQGRM
eukprot:gnl/TRDRNA2_/TRDRNA2_136911_c0_seq1.p1 gnl/TRDRNA2_/TRDRNA2_136911_c0~~gnl/TRDRNA2_/TRDRNA2_136911_c0_seq1.p1  ORF type:complete len:206 (-),score=52.28 gnl/TRDRNA2_/TRDRNA2_136911_c0_seq1:82-663(-)